MKNFSLNNLTWNFIKLEENTSPSVRSYVQSLSELLNSMRPNTTTDARRLEIAKNHIKEVKKHINKLEERVEVLEEQVKLLEETKDKDIVKDE